LPRILSNISIPVLFADDITNFNPINFQTNVKEVLKRLNKWLIVNVLALNFDNIFIHSKTISTGSLDMRVEYDNRLIANTSYTKFLGIIIESMLYWESHTDQLLQQPCAAYCVF
jgi:hypothetical protein